MKLNRRWVVGLVSGLLACTGFAFGQNNPLREPRFQARVHDVVDGDTVHLQILGGRETHSHAMRWPDALTR